MLVLAIEAIYFLKMTVSFVGVIKSIDATTCNIYYYY
jgi:hypothetical protein